MLVLERHTGVSNDMRYRDKLAVRSGNPAQCGQFSRTEGRHECPSASDASIAICSIACNQLVRVALPVEPGLRNDIEQSQLIIFTQSVMDDPTRATLQTSRHSKHGLDPQLLDSLE